MKVFGKIINYKGCYSIVFNSLNEIKDLINNFVPQNLIEYKKKRDGDLYHLTVVSSNETSTINNDIELDNKNDISIDIIGFGHNESCHYLICVSKELDNLRKRLMLNSKDFHITLGFDQADKHNISKSLETLNLPFENIIDDIINNLSEDIDKNIKLLKQLNNLYQDNFLILKNLTNELCKKGFYNEALNYSLVLIDIFPQNINGYYLYLMISNKLDIYNNDYMIQIYNNLLIINDVKQKKIALNIIKLFNDNIIKYSLNQDLNMLHYNIEEQKFEKVEFIDKYNIEDMKKDMKKVVYSGIREDNYLEDFIDKLNEIIILYNNDPNKHINIYKEYDEKGINRKYIFSELPVNFSKIDEKLYGSGIVSLRHIEGLKSLKINTIINLIGEEKPKEELVRLCETHNIKLLHYGFPDRTACSFELYLEIQKVIDDINNPDNISLVHCKGGIGRTNMVLCGYMMKKSKYSPSETISILKQSRKVTMVASQILLLKKYYGYLLNNNNNNNNLSLPNNLRGLLLMVGLPCSGKSTLALEIYGKYSNSLNNIIHLNQDEIGKNELEKMLSLHAKSADLIILDRCNLSEKDRKYLIEMYMGLTSKKITVLFLNLGLDVSLKRLPERENHLTLGAGGSKIIMIMNKNLKIPDKSEGFEEIIEIKTIDELNLYRGKIGLIDNDNKDIDLLIKFPRTRHLMNLGAMARDDLLMSKTDIKNMLDGEITVEEKIDGANLGFRLSSDGKIMAQNRSHYVSSSYHPQFKKLDQWIESHKFDLIDILSRGNYIIYGEWLYSKHSINYTNLPDYFIMFDLYDIDTKSFFSRDYIEQLLESKDISLVPLMFKGKTNLDNLKKLVHTKSQFYEGMVEGVYVRSFESNKVKYRGKIVRSDFICGDEHWTKGKQILNTIIR